MSAEALTNACIVTDQGMRPGQTVVIDNGIILSVADNDIATGSCYSSRDLGGQLLAPGFVDVQVNGGGGVLFNDKPTIDTIRTIGSAHRQFGTTGFLPTLISDDLDVMATAIRAVEDGLKAGVPGLLGIHLEGPFLSTAKKGVHNAKKFRKLDADAIGLLCSLKKGVTVVTLAPETTTPEVIRSLVDAGVIVCAGHSNASYEQTRAALDAGMTGFTHLFNAMSPLTSREPGVVGAALDDANSWCGLIMDGHHVHEASARVAVASRPTGRCILVTDAMPSVGAVEKSFELGGRRITVSNGKCETEDGTLAGSDLDMVGAVRNSIRMLRTRPDEALRMASQYPAEFTGHGNILGRIQPGFRANLVLLDDALEVVETWIDGVALQ
jgi:N-acetylglucosamine-6-phosphate deacetylase